VTRAAVISQNLLNGGERDATGFRSSAVVTAAGSHQNQRQ
jgi:hypothetical protein